MIMKNETIISQAAGTLSRQFYLVHAAAALVPAGSISRFDNECFKVVYCNSDGCRAGQAFKTLPEAKTYFAKYTSAELA